MSKHKKLTKQLTEQTKKFLGPENVESVTVMMGTGYFAYVTNKASAAKLKRAWNSVDGQTATVRPRKAEGVETRNDEGELIGYEPGPVIGYSVTATFDDE